jgi:hypothetical protein
MANSQVKQVIKEPNERPADQTGTDAGKSSLDDTEYLKKYILDCKKEAEDATGTVRTKWQELWQVYQNKQDYSKKEDWQSQSFIPKLFMAVERASLLIERAILQTNKLFNIEMDDEFVLPLKSEIKQAAKQFARAQKEAAKITKEAQGILKDIEASQTNDPNSKMQILATIEAQQSAMNAAEQQVTQAKEQLDKLQEQLEDYQDQASDDDKLFKAHLKKTNFTSSFGEAVKSASLLGFGAHKRIFNGAKQRLSFENTDVQNLYITPNYKPFQEENPRYAIEYKEMDLADLISIAKEANKETEKGNEHAKKPVFDMDEIEKIQESYREKEHEERLQRRDMDEYTPVNKKVILEFWGDVVSKGGKEIKSGVLMWLANEKYLIRNHENAYKDRKHPWDFIIPIVYPNRGVAGISMVEALVKLQYTLNNLHNLFIDNLTFTVNTMLEYCPQDLIEPEKMTRIFPGKLIKRKANVQGPAVTSVAVKGIGADAFKVFELTTRELQEGSAVTEFLQGMPGRQQKTLGEIEIKTSESHGYFDVIARKLEVNCLSKLLRNAYEMLEQFTTDKFKNSERYQFNVGGLSLLLMQKQQVENLLQAIGIAIKLQGIVPPEKIKKLWDKLASVWDIADDDNDEIEDRLLPPEAIQKQLPAAGPPQQQPQPA